MSAEEAKEQGYELIPKWLPILMSVATGLVTAGVMWATINSTLNYQGERIQALEIQSASLRADIYELRVLAGRIDENVKNLKERVK